jgi:hypothetical protein
MKIDMRVLRKSVKEIKVSLKYAKSNGYVTGRHMYIYDHVSPNFSQNERFLDNSCAENQIINVMLNNCFLQSSHL